VAEPIRVLIVEDNVTFRETLELLFGMSSGIDVVESVATGNDAAVACVRHAPDVVLMDYRMPGMNGAEATRDVLVACPGTKVVCLTASVSLDEVEDLKAAGAVACLTKEAGFDQIIEVVRAAGRRGEA